MNYFEMFGRTLVIFAVLFTLVRISGKKQVSQLTFFNYTTGITIGAIAAITCLSPRITLLQGVVSLLVWSALTILTGYLVLKLPWGRVFVEGEPIIVIKNGQVLKDSLKALRLSIDELSMMLRREKVFDFGKVAYAIVEPNGKLSVLEKPEEQILTHKDMHIPSPAFKYLPVQLISDGKIIEENMKKCNLGLSWLYRNIHAQGYNKIDDVFFAQMQSDGSLYATPRHKGK
ncbi:MAG: DUF421 domain-containing protein [Syntrophomonas sp.]